MRIIFFGSDDFASAHLEGLWDSPYEIVACVTPPDRPKGRGMRAHISPVKQFALDQGIDVLQPADVKTSDFVDALRSYAADMFVVIAYGRLLPAEVLDIPSMGALNVHGSLLPSYRGAAPINWAVINGESVTGLSIIRLNTAMDAGDVTARLELPIFPEDTSVTLRAKMMAVGPEFLCCALADMEHGRAESFVQDVAQVTFAPKLTKAHGLIDWTQSARDIHNKVRGLLPWPSAYTYIKGKPLKLLKTELLPDEATTEEPGKILDVRKDGLVVAAGDGALLLKDVHPAASKPMSAHSFANGQRICPGDQMEGLAE